MNIVTALSIAAGICAYLSAGRAHWTLMVQHDAGFGDQADCQLVTGLARGDAMARFVRASFIALWPAWLALGFILATINGLRRP